MRDTPDWTMIAMIAAILPVGTLPPQKSMDPAERVAFALKLAEEAKKQTLERE